MVRQAVCVALLHIDQSWIIELNQIFIQYLDFFFYFHYLFIITGNVVSLLKLSAQSALKFIRILTSMSDLWWISRKKA